MTVVKALEATAGCHAGHRNGWVGVERTESGQIVTTDVMITQ
jgi:hypothetical protein